MRWLPALAFVLCACSRSTPPEAAFTPPATAPEFTKRSFEELYPIFLVHSSMGPGDKARLWNDLRDRWVRWEGVIASINDKGITLRQLLTTVTFDVSLTCETPTVASLKTRFHVGDRVSYVGRLDSFDDVFRTLYLTHGAVLAQVPQGDLGVPADLAH